MRISDWSSDVCSSDLPPRDTREGRPTGQALPRPPAERQNGRGVLPAQPRRPRRPLLPAAGRVTLQGGMPSGGLLISSPCFLLPPEPFPESGVATGLRRYLRVSRAVPRGPVPVLGRSAKSGHGIARNGPLAA